MMARKPPGYWTKERALKTLHEMVAAGYDLSETAKRDPRIYTGVRSAFGSFRAACEAAGYEYNVPEREPSYDQHDLLEILQFHAKQGTLGRVILDRKLVSAFGRKFEHRISGAFDRAGIPKPEGLMGALTKEQTAEFLAQWAEAEPGPIVVDSLVRKAKLAIRRYWGSLETASKELGITFEGSDDELPPVLPRGRAAWKKSSGSGEAEQKQTNPSRRRPGFWTPERVIELTRKRLTDAENPFNLQTNPEDRKLYAAARQHLGSFHEAARRAGVKYTGGRPGRRGGRRQNATEIKREVTAQLQEVADKNLVDFRTLDPELQRDAVRVFGGLDLAARDLQLTMIRRDGITFGPDGYEIPTP